MKKILAILLTAVMLIGTFGLAAFAAEAPIDGTLAIEGAPENDHFKDGSISVVYFPTPVSDASTAVFNGLNDKTLTAKVTVTGGTQGTQTATIKDTSNGGPYGDYGYAFRLNSFSAEPKLKFSAGYDYTVKTEIVDASGKTVYTFAEKTVTASYTTAGETARPIGTKKNPSTEGLTNLTDKIKTDSLNVINTKTGEHPEFYQKNTDTYWIDGLEGVQKLFDGVIPVENTDNSGNKFCTEDNEVTVIWSYTEAVTLTDYVLYTANDSAGNSARNPVSWKLYGSNDGKEWTVVDTVEYAGLEAANFTPFGRTATNPGSYTNYKIELVSGKQMQLGELVTFNDPNWKPAETQKPDETQKPSETQKPGETQKPAETQKPGTSTEKPAQTGDAMVVAVALAVVALVGTAVVVTKKRTSSK